MRIWQNIMVTFLLSIVVMSCGPAHKVATKTDMDIKSMLKHYLEDVRYGPYERNILDIWLIKSKKPTPLILYIHGGGFQKGDKSSINLNELKAYLESGFSVAAINYRLTNTDPAPAAYLDCARALQFLRHNSKKWNFDPKLIASTGGSAGAGISLWLGFHDDLADPDSDDPVARQSTRLTCMAVYNGQSSYDPRFAEKIGIPRPNFESHDFFLPFYDITTEEIDSPLAYQRYEEAAPITYVSKDDPPVLLDYGFPNEEVDGNTSLSHIVHHPKLGIALKKQLDELGIECIVQYLDKTGKQMVRHGAGLNEQPVNKVDFIRKHFEIAKRQDK
jgi:acetyl esterase